MRLVPMEVRSKSGSKVGWKERCPKVSKKEHSGEKLINSDVRTAQQKFLREIGKSWKSEGSRKTLLERQRESPKNMRAELMRFSENGRRKR